MYGILFNLIGKIFLMIILGYFLRKRNIITEAFHSELNSFLLAVCVPASIITSASNEFSTDLSYNLLLIAIISLVYYLLSLAVMKFLCRFLKMETNTKNLFISMVVFPNIAYISFPIAAELLGTEGLLYNTIANTFYILFFFTAGVSLITGQAKIQWKSVLKLPATIACIISITVYFSPFRFPLFVQETLSSIGGMITPIAMILVGSSLAEIPVISILKDRCSYLVSSFRLVIIPFIALIILKLIPGIPPAVSLHCALMFCGPTGTMSLIYAQEYDCDPTFASRALVQGTLLMVATIPIFMTCAISLLGS